MELSPGDLVVIEDYKNSLKRNTITCLILECVNAFEFLGLPDDAFLDDDIMLKEVYKVFVRGTISLISKENILGKINDKEIED